MIVIRTFSFTKPFLQIALIGIVFAIKEHLKVRKLFVNVLMSVQENYLYLSQGMEVKNMKVLISNSKNDYKNIHMKMVLVKMVHPIIRMEKVTNVNLEVFHVKIIV